MLDELGIELIYANTAEAKGKIENKNKVVQNRLLNDIIRFKIRFIITNRISINNTLYSSSF